MAKDEFMRQAIELSRDALRTDVGGPFGAVLVQYGKVIASGQNRVLADNDPTAHAEIVAIREAARQTGSFQLRDCELYTSCEPCPMCLGAIYWARIEAVYYANTRADAAAIGFDDEFIYREINLSDSSRRIPFRQILRNTAIVVFEDWHRRPDRRHY